MKADRLSVEDLIVAARPVVERVVRKRFFGVLPGTGSYESERARDCVQQTLLKLVAKRKKVAKATKPMHYAARIAHNVVNDVIRPPNWTRLKNRLLRVISQTPDFAIWNDPQLGKVCGYVGWRTQVALRPQGVMAKLRHSIGDLRREPVLAIRWDNMGLADRQVLLERVFDIAGGPIETAMLVTFLAELLEIGSEISLSDLDPDDE